MPEPKFWSKPPGWQAALLSPLAAIYGAATARRVARPPRAAPPIPVISVGNLNAGGTGKTPTVIALIERLAGRDKRAVVLSRGYGGSLTAPTLVDPVRHKASAVGDEPLMLAAFAPTVISRKRADGVPLCLAQGADVILLDDGHQNPDLRKDLSLVTVNASRGFGNGRVIPAGPLREPLDVGLARGDILLTIGPGQEAFTKRYPDLPLPQVTGQMETLPSGMPWAGLPAFAFAGIAHPEAFFATLRDLGADLRATEALPDHHPIDRRLFERMLQEARAEGAQLVTTEKDAARLGTDQRKEVVTLPIRLVLDNWGPIDAALSGLGL